MIGWRKRWRLGVGSVGLDLTGGGVQLRRSWAPRLSASVTTPTSTIARALDSDPARQPYVLTCELVPYDAALTLDTTIGPTLAAAFPDLGATYYATPDEATAGLGTVRRSWIVYRGSVRHAGDEGTSSVELMSIDGMLVEVLNGSPDPWLPAVPEGGVELAEALRQACRFARVPVTVVTTWPHIVAGDELAPWMPGQSLWEWWNGLRAAAELTYTVEARYNRIVIGAPAASFPPWRPPLALRLGREDSERDGSTLGELDRFADALTITWEWADAEGTHSAVSTHLAPGVTDWREARRHRALVRRMRPSATHGDELVRRLAEQWRATITVRAQLAPDTLTELVDDLHGIDYTLGDDPGVTFTYPDDGMVG